VIVIVREEPFKLSHKPFGSTFGGLHAEAQSVYAGGVLYARKYERLYPDGRDQFIVACVGFTHETAVGVGVGGVENFAVLPVPVPLAFVHVT
jgi:hypothetical protein